jgi:hypothetical protein
MPLEPSPPRATPADSSVRERVRAELLAAIPSHYSPWLHLGLTSGLGLGVIALALTALHRPSWHEALAVPAMVLLSNASEWFAHRDVLHRRRWFAPVLYDRHTPQHHVVYGYDDMAIRSWRELRLVLIPAYGIAALVALVAPLALLVGLLLGPNVGWLVLLTAAAYVLAYEWSHLAYHLPPESLLGRRWLVRVLREHHRRHHHPRLMTRWNFNVTVPLFDWLQGTRAPRAVVEAAPAHPRRPAAPDALPHEAD